MPELPEAHHLVAGHESVIRDVLTWLDEGQRVWLCTIVETWGSSPRPEGSWLAISESGQWSGSVSGGCLEEDLLRRTARTGPDSPQVVDYGITNDDRDTFRLPCGGRIRLLVEPLSSIYSRDHIQAIATALARRQPLARRVRLQGMPELVRPQTDAHMSVQFDGKELLHILQPECRLLLIGAGEVARYVTEFATAADFDVTLCEPRETFADGWSYAHIPLTRKLPDDLIVENFNDVWSGVLALAHDPRIDDMGLLAALALPGFYVGAMGSQKSSEARRQRLSSLGLDKKALDRLRAPVGINIPSKTPVEIAISVVADLITARHHLRVALPIL
jgi:xanthine dehydrogenase accessory factor